MRLLADESLEDPVIAALCHAGHDVFAIAERAPRSPDARVLDLGNEQGRLLVTNDKDFAELAFLQRHPSEGIVLLRMPRSRSAQKADRLVQVLQDHGDRLLRCMTVIEVDILRRRSFLGGG